MQTLTRRQFAQGTLGSLLCYSLLETLVGGDVLADEIKPTTARWLKQLDDMSRQVKGQKLKQTEWQTKVEQLLAKVDLEDLLRFIDFDKLTRDIRFRERGERAIRPRLPEVEGLPRELVFGHQVFALQKDRSVVPHGHDNMATLFLILKGSFHGRNYDRLEDDAKFMIIKPTIDRPFRVGEVSTISDYKDNVHWFTATSQTAFIFNIHVMNCDPAVKRNGRVYIDPLGEKLSGGRIKARKVGAGEATRLYG